MYTSFADNNIFDWLLVEVSVDPNDDHNYRRIIKLL